MRCARASAVVCSRAGLRAGAEPPPKALRHPRFCAFPRSLWSPWTPSRPRPPLPALSHVRPPPHGCLPPRHAHATPRSPRAAPPPRWRRVHTRHPGAHSPLTLPPRPCARWQQRALAAHQAMRALPWPHADGLPHLQQPRHARRAQRRVPRGPPRALRPRHQRVRMRPRTRRAQRPRLQPP